MKRTSQLVGHEPSLNQLSTAGVVASCKIPILATRVRFPGSAIFFSSFLCQTIGTHNYTRPADVLVDGWDRAKPAAFDVTVTSPLTPVTLNEASINEGAAALAAETRKHAANDARCQALGWSCIPLAVETFGNWGREAQGVFSRLATLLALHQGRSKSTVVRDIYGHLSISLVRSVARSIMGREIVH